MAENSRGQHDTKPKKADKEDYKLFYKYPNDIKAQIDTFTHPSANHKQVLSTNSDSSAKETGVKRANEDNKHLNKKDREKKQKTFDTGPQYSFMRDIKPAKDRPLASSPAVKRKSKTTPVESNDNQSNTLDTLSIFSRFSKTNKNDSIPNQISDRDVISVTMSQRTLRESDEEESDNIPFYNELDIISSTEEQQFHRNKSHDSENQEYSDGISRKYRYYLWWVDGIKELMKINTAKDMKRIKKYGLKIYSYNEPRLSLNFDDISPLKRLAKGSFVADKCRHQFMSDDHIYVRIKKQTQHRNKVVIVREKYNYFVGENGLVYMLPHNQGLPERIPNIKHIVQVDADYNHSLVLSREGKVFGWGSNNFFEVNPSEKTKKIDSPVLIELDDIIVSIAAGVSYSMALTDEGHVVSWGRNNCGQLGHSLEKSKSAPKRVPDLKDITQVNGGSHDSIVLTLDGTVWAMGRVPKEKYGKGRTKYSFGDDTVVLLKYHYALTSSGKVYEVMTSKRNLISGDLKVVDICGSHFPYFLDNKGNIHHKFTSLGLLADKRSHERYPHKKPCSTVFVVGSKTLALNIVTGKAKWISGTVKYNLM